MTNPKFKRDIAQISKEDWKGRLQESVVDEEGNVYAVCFENANNAEEIAKALNCHDELVKTVEMFQTVLEAGCNVHYDKMQEAKKQANKVLKLCK